MTWFKVDDGLHAHPKAFRAGTAALGLWVRAGSWAASQLTDGFVPADVVRMYGTPAMAKALVTADLWSKVEGGYQFHQWSDDGRQPTRAAVEADRAAARERMKKRRGSKAPGADQPPIDGFEDVGSEDVRANNGGTSDGVREPRPVPSRPDLQTPLLTLVCRRLSGDARTSTTDDEISLWSEAAGNADLAVELKAWLIHNAGTDLRDPGAALLGWLRTAAKRAGERAPGCGKCMAGWVADEHGQPSAKRCTSCRPNLRAVADAS